jgi:hypothetical protein
MKLTTLLPTASSSQEKARIHVVYALLGTVFFMPLQIIAMEACLILALILAARYIWKYPVASWHDTPLFKPAALFAVLAFISLAGSPKPLFGVAFYLFTVLQYFIFYNLIVVFVRGGEERRLFLLVFLASAAVVVLFGLYQYAHMLTLHEEEWVDNSAFPLLRRRMYSTLYNPNLLSEFLLMAISAAFSLLIVRKRAPKKMAVLLVLLAALALCLILTYSRGAWLSAGALVFFFGLVWDKRLWLSFPLHPLPPGLLSRRRHAPALVNFLSQQCRHVCIHAHGYVAGGVCRWWGTIRCWESAGGRLSSYIPYTMN